MGAKMVTNLCEDGRTLKIFDSNQDAIKRLANGTTILAGVSSSTKKSGGTTPFNQIMCRPHQLI
jgi:6-phosphogluconate dehydrogenase (decarboxylating)